jgi:hypothetical protein
MAGNIAVGLNRFPRRSGKGAPRPPVVRWINHRTAGYDWLLGDEGAISRLLPSPIWMLPDVADKPATKAAQQLHRRGIDLAWWDPSAA